MEENECLLLTMSVSCVSLAHVPRRAVRLFARTQTNASSDLESLRIGSTDPELVCRHPHLGAAPPPGPRQGPRAGHGDPLELLLSFGLSPAPVVSNCPKQLSFRTSDRTRTPSTSIPLAGQNSSSTNEDSALGPGVVESRGVQTIGRPAPGYLRGLCLALHEGNV